MMLFITILSSNGHNIMQHAQAFKVRFNPDDLHTDKKWGDRAPQTPMFISLQVEVKQFSVLSDIAMGNELVAIYIEFALLH